MSIETLRQSGFYAGPALTSADHGMTVEQLERAIKITADVMVRHNLRQIMPTLKRLEAERDRLLREGDPIEYAKQVLGRAAA